MKKTLILLMLCFSMSSCSYKITRSGYVNQSVELQDRDLKLVKKLLVSDSSVTKLGNVSLQDSALTTTCNGADAIAILRKEGLSVGADLIHIKNAARADMGSSCYRCEADLYKIRDGNLQIETDPEFTAEKVAGRVTKDKRRNNLLRIGSVVMGVTIGFFVI